MERRINRLQGGRSKEKSARLFFETLGKKLHFKNLDDYYRLTKKDIYKFGGKRWLEKNSVVKVLEQVFPEYKWLPWKFKNSHVTPGFWDIPSNQKQFVDWLAEKLNIKQFEDWYRISWIDISNVAPASIFIKHGMLPVLTRAYPEHQWDSIKFQQRQLSKRSSQRLLALAISKLFPQSGIWREFFLISKKS
jgi:hypothetical protein